LAGAAAAGCNQQTGSATRDSEGANQTAWRGDFRGAQTWQEVRALFPLADDAVHLTAMLITSHPRPVAAAIEGYRRSLDRDPIRYLQANNEPFQRKAIEAAADYTGVEPECVALVDSTTMGVALIYGGLALKPGDEILTTNQDYFVTHESVRLAAERTGAVVRKIDLYDDIADASPADMAARISAAISPATRVVALTWVHSSTGLKIPARQIADAVTAANRGRGEEEQILFCLDGVHGFGNQDVDVADLGCDLFAAGCHKWLFGPRGTGVLIGSEHGRRRLRPVIPSFIDDAVWASWLRGGELRGPGSGTRFSPGGFKAFEHVWALPAAFEMHNAIGRMRIAKRTAELARRAKEGLARMGHIRLVTPMADDMSAGIVSFDIDGLPAEDAAARLTEQGIIASAAPYAVQHVRLTPCIYNSEADIDRALEEVGRLA
jgi:isopenicillin-N epimerase